MFSVEPYRTEPGIWQTSHPATMAEPRKQGASGERPIARVLDERSCHSGAKPRPWPPVSVQSRKTSTEARPQLDIAHIVPGATLHVLPDDAVLAAAYFDITLCVWSTLPNHGIFLRPRFEADPTDISPSMRLARRISAGRADQH